MEELGFVPSSSCSVLSLSKDTAGFSKFALVPELSFFSSEFFLYVYISSLTEKGSFSFRYFKHQFEIGSQVSQAGLELLIVLALPPEFLGLQAPDQLSFHRLLFYPVLIFTCHVCLIQKVHVIMVPTCGPSPWEVETGRSGV